MLASHGSTGKMSTVNMPAVRDELAATLEETLRLQQRLMDDVRDEGVPGRRPGRTGDRAGAAR